MGEALIELERYRSMLGMEPPPQARALPSHGSGKKLSRHRPEDHKNMLTIRPFTSPSTGVKGQGRRHVSRTGALLASSQRVPQPPSTPRTSQLDPEARREATSFLLRSYGGASDGERSRPTTRTRVRVEGGEGGESREGVEEGRGGGGGRPPTSSHTGEGLDKDSRAALIEAYRRQRAERAAFLSATMERRPAQADTIEDIIKGTARGEGGGVAFGTTTSHKRRARTSIPRSRTEFTSTHILNFPPAPPSPAPPVKYEALRSESLRWWEEGLAPPLTLNAQARAPIPNSTQYSDNLADCIQQDLPKRVPDRPTRIHLSFAEKDTFPVFQHWKEHVASTEADPNLPTSVDRIGNPVTPVPPEGPRLPPHRATFNVIHQLDYDRTAPSVTKFIADCPPLMFARVRTDTTTTLPSKRPQTSSVTSSSSLVSASGKVRLLPLPPPSV